MNAYTQPKTKNPSKLQQWFRNKKWGIDQYWKIRYTLYIDNSEEKDYVSIVKARSFDLAKDFLFKKTKEDDHYLKIKNLRGYMFHSNYCFERSSNKSINLINMKDWENIRNSAYPNENNHLFKMVVKIRSKGEITERNSQKIKNLL